MTKNPWNLNLELWNLVKGYELNVKSITIDQGWEFNLIFYIGYRLKIYIYKADPYALHQRGTIENINEYIRRYFKKKH